VPNTQKIKLYVLKITNVNRINPYLIYPYDEQTSPSTMHSYYSPNYPK